MNAPNDRPPERDERIARIEAILPTLATKADLAEAVGALRTEMHKGFGDLRADMRDVAISTTRWMLGTILAVLAGMVALYVKPSGSAAPAQAPITINVSRLQAVVPAAPAASR